MDYLDEEILFKENLEADFKGKLRLRWNVGLGGLGIPKPGTLEILFLVDEEVVGSYKIPVQKIGGVEVKTEQV